MKYYSLGETSRYKIVIVLGVAAIVLTNILDKFDYLIPFYSVEDGWFGYKGVSVFLFGVLFWLFDQLSGKFLYCAVIWDCQI